MVFTMQYMIIKNVPPILGIRDFTRTTPPIPRQNPVKGGDSTGLKLQNFSSVNHRLVSLAKRRNQRLTTFLCRCQQVREGLLREVLTATLRDDRVFCSYGQGRINEVKS